MLVVYSAKYHTRSNFNVPKAILNECVSTTSLQVAARNGQGAGRAFKKRNICVNVLFLGTKCDREIPMWLPSHSRERGIGRPPPRSARPLVASSVAQQGCLGTSVSLVGRDVMYLPVKEFIPRLLVLCKALTKSKTFALVEFFFDYE